jgi:Protein of unknown function (DUF5818)
MNRTTNLCAGFLLAITPLAFGQESQPTPRFPEDALVMQQPIAWTRLQKPQPAPQPLPPRDTAIPQPDQQDEQGKQPADPQTPPQQTPINQSFTGKIVRDGDKYVLKVATNTTYELQDQGDVKRYENQNVKVIGKLDTGSNTIRVVKIELLSYNRESPPSLQK